MGFILSKFRKKPSTKEQLEKIQQDIRNLESFQADTQETRKKIIGRLVIYSVALYFIGALVAYLWYSPSTFKDHVICAIPLLIFPTLIWTLKNFLTWYYHRKMARNDTKLASLKQEKAKILDVVMETETFKVAREILEKFAPEQLRKLAGADKSIVMQPNSPEAAELRRRANAAGLGRGGGYGATPRPPGGAQATPSRYGTGAVVAYTPGPSPRASPGGIGTSGPVSPYGAPGNTFRTPAIPPQMQFPVIQRDRSYMDKLVEYLVGDGPSNRYALICKQCESHNGMALKEEYEYLSFRCCYCHHYNPARKLRPTAPRLLSGGPSFGGGSAPMSATAALSGAHAGDTSSDDSDAESGEESATTSGDDKNRASSPFAASTVDGGGERRDVSREVKSGQPSVDNAAGRTTPPADGGDSLAAADGPESTSTADATPTETEDFEIIRPHEEDSQEEGNASSVVADASSEAHQRVTTE